MEILYRCCAGLDVHKKTLVACVRRIDAAGKVHQAVRTFGTMTCHLLALSDWLAEQGVEQVAMESTGVYWKPVFNILEGRLAVMLVNAQHIKQVPGRKTDVKDCAWIAQLLQHGLLRASFVPPPPLRELRDLTRLRAQLVAEKATAANRIQKVLEDANIKLASVATDVLGVSGRDMLEAIIAGEDDAEKLADLARKRLRNKIPALQTALRGRVTKHHRFQLRLLLDHVDHGLPRRHRSAWAYLVTSDLYFCHARPVNGYPIDFSDYLERSIDTSPSSAGFSIQGGRAVMTLLVKMTPTTEGQEGDPEDAQSWYGDIGNFYYVTKGALQDENNTDQTKWKPMWP